MNKTSIDWCDLSWNPITGCYHECDFCYAKRIATRFAAKDLEMVNGKKSEVPLVVKLYKPVRSMGGGGLIYAFPFGFTPTFHRYRLDEPTEIKKPSNVFVGSMADVFGDWVPDEWIRDIISACDKAPQHNYLFLTKNPERIDKLIENGVIVPHNNFWFGSTVIGKNSKYFEGCGRYHSFLSVEPIFEDVAASLNFSAFEWIIVGAETGGRKEKVTPKREWIQNLVDAAEKNNVPILIKDSKELKAVWNKPLIQQFPKGLTRG